MGTPPFVRLPEEIVLARAEVATILFALDVAEESLEGPARDEVSRARILLTSKL